MAGLPLWTFLPTNSDCRIYIEALLSLFVKSEHHLWLKTLRLALVGRDLPVYTQWDIFGTLQWLRPIDNMHDMTTYHVIVDWLLQLTLRHFHS